MSGIEQLGERVADAERRFGLIYEQQTKYSERLLGFMNAVEVRLNDQQAEIDRQSAEIARLSGDAQRHADESARLSAEIERRIVDAAHQAEENEQLRTMLHSLLRAIEAGSRDALAETMQALDRKVTALIGDSEAVPADATADAPGAQHELATDIAGPMESRDTPDEAGIGTEAAGMEAVADAMADGPDPDRTATDVDLAEAVEPAGFTNDAGSIDASGPEGGPEIDVAGPMAFEDTSAEGDEPAEGVDMAAAAEAAAEAPAPDQAGHAAEAERADAMQVEDSPGEGGRMAGTGETESAADTRDEVMAAEDGESSGPDVAEAMAIEEAADAAAASAAETEPVAQVRSESPTEDAPGPAVATLSEIMQRVTRLVEQTGGEIAVADRVSADAAPGSAEPQAAADTPGARSAAGG